MQEVFKKYSVLYAEDEERVRANYVKYFKTLFHTVYEAADGDEALSLYTAHQPDILLLDITMPKLNGLELSRLVRQNDDKTAIIILTAHLDTEKLLLATELRLTKYLSKPVSQRSLLEALRIAVDKIEKTEKKEDCLFLDNGHIWEIKRERLMDNGEEVLLTKNEKYLCSYLFEQADETRSIQDILNFFWCNEPPIDMSENALRGLIKRLRKKTSCNCIENIYGLGYRVNTTHS